MKTKLHAVSDANGRPISLFMTVGQVSDYTAAAAQLNTPPKAQWMLADLSYDADWFHDALQGRGITSCIPGRKSRSRTVQYDKRSDKHKTASRSCSDTYKDGDGLPKDRRAAHPP